MEKGKISSFQMAIMMYPAILATIILGVPKTQHNMPKQIYGCPPLLASVIGYMTVYVAYKLHKLYPKQTIIQISSHIIGWLPGKILGFLFLFFYIQVTGIILREYAEFIVNSFLINTPSIIIMASMVLLCAFLVYGGLEGLGRVAQLILPMLIFPPLILSS